MSNHSPAQGPKTRLEALDVLRVLATLAAVMSHTSLLRGWTIGLRR